MKVKKTRKLICQVSGKPLLAAAAYYEKKVEKAGGEDELHRTYICSQVKKYLKKGYTIDQTRDAVGTYNDFKSPLSDDDIPTLINDKSFVNLRLNNIDTVKLGVIKTDPEVLRFIENLKND